MNTKIGKGCILFVGSGGNRDGGIGVFADVQPYAIIRNGGVSGDWSQINALGD